MTTAHWLVTAVGAALAVYLVGLIALVLAGRRTDARALAGFIPDCVVLCRRLLGDPRVPASRKVACWALLAYLALPLDLVPDVIPVAGQLDDALLLALVLRSIARSAGPDLLAEHWPGPPRSLGVVRRLAGL